MTHNGNLVTVKFVVCNFLNELYTILSNVPLDGIKNAYYSTGIITFTFPNGKTEDYVLREGELRYDALHGGKLYKKIQKTKSKKGNTNKHIRKNKRKSKRKSKQLRNTKSTRKS